MRFRVLVLAAVVASGLVVTSVAPAEAATKTKATLSFGTDVTAGSAFAVHYRVKGPKSGAKAELQVKTGKKYKRVTKLAVTKTAKVVVAPGIGAYGYRVKVTLASGKVVYSKTKRLHAFGDIEYGHVAKGAIIADSKTLGGTTFTWWKVTGLGHSTAITGETSCRSMTAQIGLESNTPGTLTIQQAGLADQVIALAPNAVTVATFPLSGGDSSGLSGPNGYVYIGGTVNCYTADGARP